MACDLERSKSEFKNIKLAHSKFEIFNFKGIKKNNQSDILDKYKICTKNENPFIRFNAWTFHN